MEGALGWFGAAQWNARADRNRTTRLLPVWVHAILERTPDRALEAITAYQSAGGFALQGKSLEMYQELCHRLGRVPQIETPPPPSVDPAALMEHHMNRTLTGLLGDTVEVSADVMSVRSPDGDTYEVGMRDGRIRRLSDGRQVRLEIDWNEFPFSVFRGAIDAADLNGPF